MTREESIKLVKEVASMSLDWDDAHYEALQMAIKALEQEPCEDCISREALLDKKWDVPYDGKYIQVVDVGDIKELPSVTLTRKKGKWIVLKDEYGDICEAICSCCEDNGNHRWKYCHTCGAEMESEE